MKTTAGFLEVKKLNKQCLTFLWTVRRYCWKHTLVLLNVKPIWWKHNQEHLTVYFQYAL